MKRTLLLLSASIVIGASPCALVSCQTGPNAQAGTAYGAVGGGVLGGLIGSQNGHWLPGAAIGAAAGGLTGNYIGGAYDRPY